MIILVILSKMYIKRRSYQGAMFTCGLNDVVLLLFHEGTSGLVRRGDGSIYMTVPLDQLFPTRWPRNGNVVAKICSFE